MICSCVIDGAEELGAAVPVVASDLPTIAGTACFLQYFKHMTDKRPVGKVDHPLPEILLLPCKVHH
jgi:hypothetical protein